MSRQFDRRAFLRRGATGAVALAVGPGLLAACSTDDTSASAKAGGGSSPRSGGTLRAAFVGGGASETLDFFNGPSALDLVRARAWHGTLGNLDPSAPDGVRYGVLKGIDMSDDLSTYTLHVRPGVRFTDGSQLTSADILHSLSVLAGKSMLPVHKMAAANFDLPSARADGDLKVVLPTLRPVADGRMILCQGNFLIVKDGTRRFGKGMPSCGPFRLDAFTPGQGSVFTRYDEHYGHVPHLDGLELRSIADSTARAGALTSGEIDFAHDLSPVTARTHADDGNVEVVPTRSPYVVGLSFQMNMSVEPFDDPRVREAFRLAANREAMVKTVFDGDAVVGNDLPSIGFPDYAESVPQRAYDPERARKLLKAAGADGVEVVLTTGPETPGMVELATLFVEDLKKVGVRASVRELPAGQLYADFTAYSRMQLAASYQMPIPALSTYQMNTAGGSPSAFGWKQDEVDALVAKARAERDGTAARKLGAQAQRIRWDEGNQVLPVFKPNLDAQTKGVSGIRDDLFEQFPGFAQASLA
ncbi:ABC transporter substrate-binding protein [Streptomyces sp. NBC_01012]|uniref:ABC transporter substrate-binding protein n=1 Tax=Streptomyces sp. NBC_01012 TaxID=2903717 RepID=UPI0038692422|nr:ABC transporter substrate-binding protein [Streptomyces sp. NBC_01012]